MINPISGNSILFNLAYFGEDPKERPEEIDLCKLIPRAFGNFIALLIGGAVMLGFFGFGLWCGYRLCVEMTLQSFFDLMVTVGAIVVIGFLLYVFSVFKTKMILRYHSQLERLTDLKNKLCKRKVA